VWEIRFRWEDLKPALQAELIEGRFCFSPLRRIHGKDEDREIWSALDSLVLKALAIVLTKYIASNLSSKCFHLAGNGGAKAAVREVVEKLPENEFVFRTDVKSYYASIDHDVLFSQLKERIDDPLVLDLLWQYMRRVVYDGGFYEDVERGISLGCPLSPLMGALFLDLLDRRMEVTGLVYVRFMDDWVVLSATRWKLRKAVRIVNQTLTELKVRQHPEKTFIGRINRGFDFLGYAISRNGLKPASKTVKKFAERLCQLYEQGADTCRMGQYVRRWWQWLNAGGLRVSTDDRRSATVSIAAWAEAFSDQLRLGSDSHLSFGRFLLSI
jgi:RNA-directed DNA polymerase